MNDNDQLMMLNDMLKDLERSSKCHMSNVIRNCFDRGIEIHFKLKYICKVRFQTLSGMCLE